MFNIYNMTHTCYITIGHVCLIYRTHTCYITIGHNVCLIYRTRTWVGHV